MCKSSHTCPLQASGSSLSPAWPRSACPIPSPHHSDGTLEGAGCDQTLSTPTVQHTAEFKTSLHMSMIIRMIKKINERYKPLAFCRDA